MTTTKTPDCMGAISLPGGVGFTHLKVYDSPAPDGICGGSAHVHFACTEAYYVLRGRGAVQTLSVGGFEERTLAAGEVVYFSPGVIHRLVNSDGELEILVTMQNAGLPEAGDFVLAFAPEILADAARYAAFAALSGHGEVYSSSGEKAARRRDLSIEGFTHWRAQFEARGVAALDEFYELSLPLIAPKIAAWREVWEAVPLRAATQTGVQLDALQRGDLSHLRAGHVASIPAPDGERKWGMCGTLGIYPRAE